tara:strand:+ start:10175 stop:10453 length:279 start_codon:yes stop_codon:yes gene_type:complete
MLTAVVLSRLRIGQEKAPGLKSGAIAVAVRHEPTDRIQTLDSLQPDEIRQYFADDGNDVEKSPLAIGVPCIGETRFADRLILAANLVCWREV